MVQDSTHAKLILVQVMAWCRQATSHYLSQCWARSASSYGAIISLQTLKCFVWLSPLCDCHQTGDILTPHEHKTYPVVGSYWSEIITDLDGGLLPYKRLRLTCFLNYGWHNCCSVHVSGTKTSIFWSHALSQGQKHQYFDHIRRLQCMDFVCQTRNNSSVINLIYM